MKTTGFAVEIAHLGEQAGEGEVRLGPRAARFPQRPTPRGVLEQLHGGAGQPGRIARGDQHPGDAVLHDVHVPRNPGREHGQAADHGLQQGERQALLLRAEGFSAALEKIYSVAQNVDQKTMTLQYFDTLKSLGASPATKYIFPMEFTSMISNFVGGGDKK